MDVSGGVGPAHTTRYLSSALNVVKGQAAGPVLALPGGAAKWRIV